MQLGEIYYVNFKIEGSNEIVVNAIAKCTKGDTEDIPSMSGAELETIHPLSGHTLLDGKIITCRNYTECKNLQNGNGYLITIKKVNENKHPEYFL